MSAGGSKFLAKFPQKKEVVCPKQKCCPEKVVVYKEREVVKDCDYGYGKKCYKDDCYNDYDCGKKKCLKNCCPKLSSGCEWCKTSCVPYDINPYCNYPGITGMFTKEASCIVYDGQDCGDCIGCKKKCGDAGFCNIGGFTSPIRPGYHHKGGYGCDKGYYKKGYDYDYDDGDEININQYNYGDGYIYAANQANMY